MENKIDIATILKDCPRGMELDCTIYDGVALDCVTIESNCHYNGKNDYPIKIVTKSGFSTRLTKYGQNVDIEEAKCVIFPKGKKTWEGFVPPCKFKDGDVVVMENECGIHIFIYNYITNEYNGYGYYVIFTSLGNFKINGFCSGSTYRLATEKEKEKLFQAIEENGYKWDEKNKTLEKKPTFKNGDVLYVDANDRGDDDDRYKYVFIFEEMVGCNKEEMVRVGSKVMAHCYMTVDGYFKPRNVYLVDSTYPIRFATEKEKEKLFQAIKEEGYYWDAENNMLEVLLDEPKFKVGNVVRLKSKPNYIYTIHSLTWDDNKKLAYRLLPKNDKHLILVSLDKQDNYELVPNKFDVNTLKTFDQVLVRLTNNCVWIPKLFSHYVTDPNTKYYPFVTIDNLGYPQCIPYNGNEHLRRTTNNCDEFYRVWEE